jgi:hypothetical protein
MSQAQSMPAYPGSHVTLYAVKGEPWRSVFIDASDSQDDVYLILGQSLDPNAAARRIKAGTAKAFPIATSLAVTFLVDPAGPEPTGTPPTPPEIYVAAMATAGGVLSSLSQIFATVTGAVTATISNAVLTVQAATSAIFNVAQSGNWSVDANVTNSTLDVNANVTNSSIDVNANVTNSSIDVNANVTNTSINVDANVTNSTLNVDANITNASINAAQSGTWNVNATVQNATIDVAQSGTWNINAVQSGTWNVGSVGSITETVQGNVVNTVLPVNNLVYIGYTSFSVTNLGNGSGVSSAVQASYPTVFPLVDGVVVVANSSYAQANNLAFPYTIQLEDFGTPLPQGGYIVPSFTIQYSKQDSPGYNAEYRAFLNEPVAGSRSTIAFTNVSGSTIASDTITFYLFYVKAQISNPTANPVNMQPGQGEFDSIEYSWTGTVATGGSQTLIPSGNYIKSIRIMFYADALSSSLNTLTLYNGSSAFWTTNPTTTETTIDTGLITFGDGVPNNGISLETSSSLQITVQSGYAVLASTTPPSQVGVVN